MAKGLWTSTFIGGFIAWLWMFASWNLLPWHCNVMESFPNEKAAVEAINLQTIGSGIYAYPNDCKSESLLSGTKIFLSINKNVQESGMIISQVISLITYFIGALLIALIVMQMASNNYGWKLFAVTMIGLVIGVMSLLPAWNWSGFPFNFVLVMIADNVIAWFLASFVIAGFIRPRHHQKKGR